MQQHPSQQYTQHSSRELVVEDRENDKIIRECIHKLFQIVVQSRVRIDERAYADQVNKWFNVDLAEHTGLRTHISQLLGEGLSTLFQLDVFVRSSSLPSDVLLERWSVHYDPYQSRTKKYNRSNMYKRLVILVRSVFSYTRMLPAQHLVRTSQAKFHNIQQQADFELVYRLGVNSGAVFDSPPSNFVFSPIMNSSGKLHVSVFYRKNCDFPFMQTLSPTGIHHNIIHDYMGASDGSQQPPLVQRRHSLPPRTHIQQQQQQQHTSPPQPPPPLSAQQHQRRESDITPRYYHQHQSHSHQPQHRVTASEPVQIPRPRGRRHHQQQHQRRHHQQQYVQQQQQQQFYNDFTPGSSPGDEYSPQSTGAGGSGLVYPHSVPMDMHRPPEHTRRASAHTSSSIERRRSQSDRSGSAGAAMYVRSQFGTPPPHPSRPALVKQYPPPLMDESMRSHHGQPVNIPRSGQSSYAGDFSRSPPFAGSYTASTSLQNFALVPPGTSPPLKQPMAIGSQESKSSFSDSDDLGGHAHHQKHRTPSHHHHQQQQQMQQRRHMLQLPDGDSPSISEVSHSGSGSANGSGGSEYKHQQQLFAFPADELDFAHVEDGDDAEADVGGFIRHVEAAPELKFFALRTTNESILIDQIRRLEQVDVQSLGLSAAGATTAPITVTAAAASGALDQ